MGEGTNAEGVRPVVSTRVVTPPTAVMPKKFRPNATYRRLVKGAGQHRP